MDFSKTNGVIRALHGANLGPLCYRGTLDADGRLVLAELKAPAVALLKLARLPGPSR